MKQARRNFLKASAATALVGPSAAPLALNLLFANAASALTATDYKALVCVYLYGGNDSFNTLLATDSTSWTQYKRWRDLGSEPLSLPAVGTPNGVLPITPINNQGRSFALHPQLSGLASLFAAGRLAAVANVGPISGPLNLNNWETGVKPFLPPGIFSHSDQTAIWQSQKVEGGGYGWGGRMGDLLMSNNGANTLFTALSLDGNSTWIAGESVVPFRSSRDGGVTVDWLERPGVREQELAAILKRIMTRSINASPLEKEAAKVMERSNTATALLRSTVLPTGAAGVADPSLVTNPFTNTQVENPLAVQLQTVLRIIGARNALGVKRQVFFVGLGGFDTHSDQMTQHNYLMLQLNHALSFFDTQLGNVQGQNLRNQVTLFTASEFGRTFTSNGNGTDHGFGGHHFVLGGAVKGRDIYGTFPVTGTGHDRDYGAGVLLPQYSIDQYGGTLTKWMGLTDAEVLEVFPTLSRFSQRNLGFML